MEIILGWLALCLVPGKTCISRHVFHMCNLIVVIDHLEGLDDVATFFGKTIVYFHEVAAAVRQTVRQDRVEFPRQIPRKSVTHLYRRFQLCGTMLQNVR